MSNPDVITTEAAGRYAKALFELAEESKSLNTVEKSLAKLKAAFAKNADMQRLIESPVIAIEDQVASLTAIARKAKLGPLVVQFVGLVAQNRRAADLPSIIKAFEDMAARKRGGMIAKVTSAKKLTGAELASLKSNLKKSLGHSVDVETSVDADLLGGFVVRLGSRLYDHSLKTKLEDLKIAMKEV